MGHRRIGSDLDRRQLIGSLCALGSAACLGCSRLARAVESERATPHRFAAMSDMSFEEVFRVAYVNSFIPTMKVLAERVGLETIQAAACDSAADETRRMAEALPSRGLADFARPLKQPDRFLEHVLAFAIVEDRETAFEVRVTECLWATTFRRADAADLGYVWVCHPDFAMAQAFNPDLRLTRDSTLMQGGAYCNHRWEIDR
ncbi:MAG: L-2-amino-thiazoline-4-carboxylic acid hydrolase [Thermoanaerobaculales bacterium]|jgi:hypothetical protein|nr:L-2-amino-thiazoline-4-carboxylic acid hydrolase [Thermoanaerobaculales bacterium]